MKKFFAVFALVMSVSLFANAASADYYVNDFAIDQVFEASAEMSFTNLMANSAMANHSGVTTVVAEKDAIIAFILCWFLGGFGIHRHYLGTKGHMWALYTFTCGGIFGVVTFVDWVMILVDGVVGKNIDKYVNNEKFFMWL